MPSPRSWSPAPLSPLGPGFRPSSPPRTPYPSPARRPMTESRTSTPLTSRPSTPTVTLTAPDDCRLHQPQLTHLPTAPLRPISTADSVRDSSVSAFDFMEAMLAPYERDDNIGDSDEEELSAESDEIVTPVEEPKVGDKRDKAKVATDERIRSCEGDLGEDTISFPSSQTKRKTVILFPSPNLEPTKPRSPVSHAVSRIQPPRQDVRIITRPHPHSHAMSPQYPIPNLPSSGVPISPHLAAPPSPALNPPLSPFAAPNSSSSSSESITGFDLLKEKSALVRGGDEEVISPISPRKGRQEGGLRSGVRTRTGVPSTVDFWKRFSVSVNKMEGGHMEKGQSQDSEWLSDAQKRRNRIKCMVLIGVVIIAIVAGGIAAGVVLSKSGQENKASGVNPLCVRAAGGGAAAGASGGGLC